MQDEDESITFLEQRDGSWVVSQENINGLIYLTSWDDRAYVKCSSSKEAVAVASSLMGCAYPMWSSNTVYSTNRYTTGVFSALETKGLVEEFHARFFSSGPTPTLHLVLLSKMEGSEKSFFAAFSSDLSGVEKDDLLALAGDPGVMSRMLVDFILANYPMKYQSEISLLIDHYTKRLSAL